MALEMSDEKVTQLLRALARKTQEGHLVWQSDQKVETTFHAATDSARFVLLSDDDDGYPPFTLQIRNSEFQVIDSIDTDIEPTTPDVEQINEELAVLYESVRRQVLKVDQTLDMLFDELGLDT